MEEKHYIEWIEVTSGKNLSVVGLKPGEKPEAEFCTPFDHPHFFLLDKALTPTVHYPAVSSGGGEPHAPSHTPKTWHRRDADDGPHA